MKKNTHPFIIFISIVIFCNNGTYGNTDAVWADVIDTYFEQISIEDGLSSNIVKAVVEDKEGFIWFGTPNGLNRYDGKNISIFRNDPDIPNSLSHNHISTLFVDSEGTLWVGTMQGGLCRYREDGNFDIFKYDIKDNTSISNNQIWCIYEDSKKNFWIGTQTGLNRLNRETGTFERFIDFPTPNVGNSSRAVLSIIEDKEGRVWLGAWDNGVYLIVPKNTIQGRSEISFLPVSEGTSKLSNNNPWSLHIDYRGRLWVGVYYGGLFLMDVPDCDDYYTCSPEEFTFKAIDYHRIEGEEGNIALSFWEDKENNLFVGHNLGLVRINLDDFYEQPNKNPYTYFDFSRDAVAGVINRQVNDVYMDSNDLLWVANTKGVYKYFGHQLKFEKELNDFCIDNQASILSFFLDNDNKLWIGISGEGILMKDLSTGKLERFYHNPPDGLQLENIRSIYGDNTSTIWAGSWNSELYSIKYNGKKPVIRYHKNPYVEENGIVSIIRSIAKGKDDEILIATFTGLFVYDTKSNKFIRYIKNESNVNSLKGELFDIVYYKDTHWIATAGGGLHKLTWKENTPYFKYYEPQADKANSIKSNILFDIELVGDNLWIGSGSSIQKYNITQDSFYQIPTLDRRISGQILSIAHDAKQRLWFTTNDGLYCYDSTTDLLSNYTPDEGLPSNFEFRASYTTQDGQMYFGGMDGYVGFSESDIINTDLKASVQITNFKLFNKPLTAGKKDKYLNKPIINQSITSTDNITLSPKHDVITIDYSVLDYLAPNQYEYAYMLEGFDNDWNFAGKKTNVTYTNLSSYKYTFLVKARSKSGAWTDVKKLGIEVLTPYWMRWWFIAACVLCILFGAYAYMRYHEHNIRQKNTELEILVTERTEALNNNIKELKESETTLHQKNIELQKILESNTELEQFAHAVAHDLKQPIRSIEGFSSILKRKLEKKNALEESEKEFFGLIKKGVLNMNQLITGLLDYSKVSSSKDDKSTIFSAEEIILTVKSNLSKQIEESNTSIKYNLLPLKIYGVKIKLIQLFQNLISNSIKFRKEDTPCIIKISVKEQRRHWLFRLEDNGIGIPSSSRTSVFQVFKRAHANYEGTGIGLATCKRIIQQHGGDIWVDSEFDGGTVFYFYIQKRADKNSTIQEQQLNFAKH